MLTDLRLATRTLLRTPGFAVAAALTIAIGVGANATMFGVVDAVMLRALPFRDESRVVRLFEVTKDGNDRMPLSPANFADWRRQTRAGSAFADMSAVYETQLTLDDAAGGEPERIAVARSTGNLPQVLGITPVLGRAYTAANDVEGQTGVILLGHRLWQRRFGGDSGIVGRDIRLDGRPFTVLGVLPPDVRWPESTTEAWTPIPNPPQWWDRNRGNHFMLGVARLAPGTTLPQAQSELARVARAVNDEYRDIHGGWSARVVPVREATVGSARGVLLVLLGAVGFVLLLGGVNVANLALVRAGARRREVAVRTALGAHVGHLLRMHAAESVVLGLAGGSLGIVVAKLATAVIPLVAPAQILRLDTVRVDWRVAAFALGLGVLATFFSAAWPAVAVARSERGMASAMRDGGRGATAGRGRAQARDLLFVAEVALALMLLAGAGVGLRSLHTLLETDTGFQPERVMTAAISLPVSRYPNDTARSRFTGALLERLHAAPGVTAATVGALPLSGERNFMAFWLPGAAPTDRHMTEMSPVTEDYFATMGVPLLAGRTFATTDHLGAPGVAVVNERLAREVFGGATQAIGRHVMPFGTEGPRFEIVGIVGATRHASLHEAPVNQLYLAQRQVPTRDGFIVLRGRGEPGTLAMTLRDAVRAVDPRIALDDVRPMSEVIGSSMARPRFVALLLGTFAGCALLLALVGIYGVVAHGVAQRSNEFGIRAALGANPFAQVRDVIGGAAKRAGLGVLVGLAGAAVVSRVVAAQLPGARATDPTVLACVALVIAATALVASWIPARRAMRASPLAALRAE